jgi:hypothetical protein
VGNSRARRHVSESGARTRNSSPVTRRTATVTTGRRTPCRRAPSCGFTSAPRSSRRLVAAIEDVGDVVPMLGDRRRSGWWCAARRGPGGWGRGGSARRLPAATSPSRWQRVRVREPLGDAGGQCACAHELVHGLPRKRLGRWRAGDAAEADEHAVLIAQPELTRLGSSGGGDDLKAHSIVVVLQVDRRRPPPLDRTACPRRGRRACRQARVRGSDQCFLTTPRLGRRPRRAQ